MMERRIPSPSREGIKFHNGADVTVDDVKYSIERCADTSNGEPLVSAFSNIAGVETPDGKTVVIHLTEADTEFLAYLTTAIIPKDNENPDTDPIGTGPPFNMSQGLPRRILLLKKFADYWGTPAYLDEVTFKVLSDSNAIVTGLKGGSIDMFARIDSTQSAELKDDFTIYEGSMNLIQALYLNNAVEPFNNIKVRQAMCYAVNRQEVMDMIADGKGTAIGSSMFPAFGKYYVPELADMYPQDVTKAKELLAEAGYPDGFECSIFVNGDLRTRSAQILQAQLADVGIKVDISTYEWGALLDTLNAGEHEMFLLGWSNTSFDPDGSTYQLFYSGNHGATGNRAFFSNDKVDELILSAQRESEESKRMELYKELQVCTS